MQIELIHTLGHISRYSELLIHRTDHAIRQPCARVGGKFQSVLFITVLEHDICRTLVVQRRITYITDLQLHRQLLALLHFVAECSANQLIAVAHLAVKFVEGAILAPHIRYRLRVLALQERPMQSAHLAGSSLITCIFGSLLGIQYICFSAYRYIEGLFC